MKISAICLSLCLAALPASAAAQTPAATPKSKPQTSTASHPATHPMTTDSALLHPATLKENAPENFEATFQTTKGDFVVAVTRSWAPIGADRFYNLVKHGFFTGAPFFRIVPGFVVQFGLSGNPTVNHAWQDANIQDEPVKQSNLAGYLTFAKSSMPNSRTTQLFINLGNNAGLDSQGFSAFGKVTTGMDVVQKLYSGYGEQPDQGMITMQGSAYFSKKFPNLDGIKSASITSPAPAAGHTPASGTTHHSAPTTPKPTH
jgi:peptidyl-prolyl cis-trans isomerase A (cyclophilin A)